MGEYGVEMEISGPLAMWTRPDTGTHPTSYPVPTWPAAKGIFESIAFYSDAGAWIRPVKVEICKRKGDVGGELSFQKYTTNYRGPLMDGSKGNFQFNALILSDVCYRLHGVVENGSGSRLVRGDNPCHALQAIFMRRLKNGQCYKTPTLGWNEFVPDYWGPFRNSMQFSEQTETDVDINEDMISVLNRVFGKPVNGTYNPHFVQGEKAIIKNGVYCYDQ